MLRACWPSHLRYTQTRSPLDPPTILVVPCRRHKDGEIVVTPPADATPPVRASWTGPKATVQHTVDTLRATHLCTGTYHVHLVDALGRTSGVTTVFVDSTHLPAITGYRIDRHASSDHARDGVVTAVCEHVSNDAVFWWSNGARTTGPTLAAVKPGSYASIVVSMGGRPVHCLHCASPGVVDVELVASMATSTDEV